MLFLEKRNNGISLIKDNVVIEYGNAYNPNIEELVDLSKYKFNISPRTNITNIKNKCIEFVNNLDDINQKNLLFTGNTGLR